MSTQTMAYLQPAASPPTSSTGRPSSRRALARALELAQEAVQIDSTGEDPEGAVKAYAKSVALLNEVMERVMRGEDPENSKRRASSRRSVVAREDEARRLRSIHDTYYDRMQILVMIYNIPLPNVSSPTPTSYMSPGPYPTTPQTRPEQYRPTEPLSETNHSQFDSSSEDAYDPSEGIGSAMMAATVSPGADAGDYPTHVTPRPPAVAQAPRTNVLPPMRQPPAGPPPIRPRVDSIPRRTLGPPGHPPPNAPPPLPSTAPPMYEMTTPNYESYRYNSFSVDVPTSDEAEQYDDSEDYPDNAQEHVQMYDENEEIRRNYVPPAPRRQGTSDSEGSMSRRNQRQLDLQQALERHEPQEVYHEHTHPFAQASAPPTPLAEHHHGYTNSRPPTPASRSRGNTQSSANSSRSGESSAYSDRPTTPPPMPLASQIPQLVSNSTAGGTISQRRKVNTSLPSVGGTSLDVHDSVPPPLSRSHSPAISDLPVPHTTSRIASNQPVQPGPAAALSAPTGRNRAVSQPGRRPSLMGMHSSSATEQEPVPVMPPLPQSALPRKTSFPVIPALPSSRRESPAPYAQPLPPIPTSVTPPNVSHIPASQNGHYAPFAITISQPYSSLPPQPPSETLRRPYYIMGLLYQSMTSSTGGYLTRSLHIPHELWTQGGAKLTNLPEKGKCLDELDRGLEVLSKASNDFLKQPLSGSGIIRAMGERWARALDEWIAVCDAVTAGLGKKLGLGDGIVSKKGSGWSGKVTRTLDRMANGKSLDSPVQYVSALAKVFGDAQLFDEHHRQLASGGGTYAGLPPDIRAQIEQRLKRSAEFFVSVVLDFVIRDLGQLLDKYAKKGEKWMEE